MPQEKRTTTPYDDLTYRIIGCAMSVHRKLGPGYRENTYQRDLTVHFAEAGLTCEAQKLLEVYDSLDGSRLIGYYIPDFVLEDKIVVEIKALRGLDNSHLAQVIGYLAVGKYPIGLLINFGLRSLQYKRIFPPKNVIEHRANRQWLFVPDWLKSDRDTGQAKER